jgi:hypothetical protein
LYSAAFLDVCVVIDRLEMMPVIYLSQLGKKKNKEKAFWAWRKVSSRAPTSLIEIGCHPVTAPPELAIDRDRQSKL